jgi:hypothetical protein
MRILSELAEHGVDLRPGVKDIRIENDAVHWIDGEGQVQSAQADTVIVAKGATGDTSLADSLAAAGFTVHTIGDATGVSYIEGAMHDAARVAAAVNAGALATSSA